ncbi:50S ribosomal protein L37ae [Candidatus Woesearchaeota archaeon]|nr:50S ribosomal protein L37ae [Candidatus Woesearchaeota archaeon]MBW3021442.1 50S ribosomal protein L37ae [Candidatus Woesearchaeota archaeon]
MVDTKKNPKLGAARRFGARYGRTLKHKFSEIEKIHRSKHVCPYCRKEAVKRISAGIWSCSKCNSKFTGRAYVPTGKAVKEEVA